MRRILGVVFVLVLVGVFGFVAYKKIDKAKIPLFGHTAQADKKEETPSTPESNSAGGAAKSAQPGFDVAGGNPVDNQQPGAVPGQQPGELQQTGQNLQAGVPAQGGQTPQQSNAQAKPNAGAADPFADLAQSGPAPQAANTGAPQAAALQPNPAGNPRQGAAQAGTEAMNPFAGDLAQNEPNARTPHPGSPEPNKLAHPLADLAAQEPPRQGQTAMPATGQTPSPQAAAAQNEPAINQLLDEPSKPAVAANEKHTPSRESGPTGNNELAATPLQQHEPGQQREPAQMVANRSSSPLEMLDDEKPAARPQVGMQSARASTTTQVHSPQGATTNPLEDGFAERKPMIDENGVAQRQPSGGGPIANVGATANIGEGTEGVYKVQPADSYWTISRKAYGTSRYFMALAELNKTRIPDPTKMKPGMIVQTPSRAVLESQYAALLPKGTALPATAGEAKAAPKSGTTGLTFTQDGRPVYRTGEKDTLESIAASHLGRASRWRQILEMNRDKLSDPNRLKVGTELELPPDASNVALSTDNDDRR